MNKNNAFRIELGSLLKKISDSGLFNYTRNVYIKFGYYCCSVPSVCHVLLCHTALKYWALDLKFIEYYFGCCVDL